MKRVSVLGLCLCLLVWQGGCVHHPPLIMPQPIPLSEQDRAESGTVGIASARFTPDAKFSMPAEGGLAGAGRGATIGARRSLEYGAKGAGAILTAPGGGGHDPYAAVVVMLLAATSLALGIALAPPAALVGGVYGAVAAEPAKVVEEADAGLKRILAEAKAQEVMRDHTLQVARDKARYPVLVLLDQGPSNAAELVNYQPAPHTGIQSVLEISLLEVALLGEWLVNPPLKIRMTVRARFMRTSDDRVLYNNQFTYEGSERLFTEWAANDAKPLRKEFERCYDTLAQQVVEEVLMLYLLPEWRQKHEWWEGRGP